MKICPSCSLPPLLCSFIVTLQSEPNRMLTRYTEPITALDLSHLRFSKS
ncbi:unnamed protein product [Brassica napus]|uniref:(rape) hypothetical protein n=1 Tax=Brassica napus TaxID=3708 RepID=A0A816JPE1_BRANA|nr:unnamed protein product [Brassica napus]